MRHMKPVNTRSAPAVLSRAMRTMIVALPVALLCLISSLPGIAALALTWSRGRRSVRNESQ